MKREKAETRGGGLKFRRMCGTCSRPQRLPLAMRMDAAKTVIDRVYGKATQPIDGNLDATLQIVMSDEARELMG